MATLTRQISDQAGITPSYATPGGSGDVVDNADGKTFIVVKNGSGSPVTVTVTCQDTASYFDKNLGKITQANVTKSVAAGADAILGPFAPRTFNNASGQLAVLFSATSSVNIAAFSLQG